MILVKFLGIIDIFAAVFFWLFALFKIIPSSILIFFGFLLLIKGISFLLAANFISAGDIICAIVILIYPSYSMPLIIPILVSIFLLQKGIFSML